MSASTPRRTHRPVRVGLAAFGVIAIVVTAVFAGRPALQRIISGRDSVSAVNANDAQRAVRYGPRRTEGGGTVGQVIGGIADAPSIIGLDDATLARHLDSIQNTGATWIRFDFLWPTIEPQDNQWNWRIYDRVVSAARARGMNILGLLAYTPDWARSAACTFTDKCPPGNIAAWQDFLTTTVARYKAMGVSHWEIWNEPNQRGFWATGPDPAAYTQLLKASYPAVKSADPNAVVVTGGLAPAETRDADNYPTYDFFTAMYASGAQGSFDAAGLHPYTYPFVPDDPFKWNNYYNLGKYYDVMVANGDANKQIWSTEAGAPTGTYVSSDRRAVSEDVQAVVAKRIYELAVGRPWQGPVFWFCFRDYGTDPAQIEQNFGLLHNDWSPKPAYDAYVAAMQLPI